MPANRFKTFTAVVLAAAFMTLAGCAYGRPKEAVTYYAPLSGWDLRVTDSAGVPNEAVILLEKHGVRIVVVAQPSYNPARIWMNVHLPEGKTMRVTDDQFTIAPRDGSPSRAEQVTYIRGTFFVNGEVIYRDLRPGDLLQGASEPSHERISGKPIMIPRQFEIVCPLGETLPESFDLALPGLEISGEAIRLPTIRFNRAVGMVRVPKDRVHHPW